MSEKRERSASNAGEAGMEKKGGRERALSGASLQSGAPTNLNEKVNIVRVTCCFEILTETNKTHRLIKVRRMQPSRLTTRIILLEMHFVSLQ